MVVSLLLGMWSVVRLVQGRPPGRVLLVGSLVVEVMLIVFLVGGIVQMIATDRELARVEFVIYLLAMAALLPLAIWWTSGENSRAAAGVLAVVFFLLPILVIRVQQVWAGTGG